MQATLAEIFRWIARLGSLVSIFILALFVFGGQEELKFLSANEVLGFCLFPITVVAGFLIAWKWELVGGLVSILGLIGFYLWNFASSGSLATGPWFIIFSSPAFVFFLAWCLKPKSNGQQA